MDQQTCVFLKQFRGYCNDKDSGYNCKKTCQKCSVVTKPSTNPPTSRPTSHSPSARPTSPPSCGYSFVSQSRIINGQDSKEGAWPWMVSLQKYNRHYCGGTLLTPKWASHKLHTVNPRITPRGLIYQQRNFGWGLIRAGVLLI